MKRNPLQFALEAAAEGRALACYLSTLNARDSVAPLALRAMERAAARCGLVPIAGR